MEAPCAHFPACGGCKLQNLEYSAQLAAKQGQVAELMARVGQLGPSGEGGEKGYMRPILGCAQQYGYRNKVRGDGGNPESELEP